MKKPDPRKLLKSQLARVIAINIVCLALFIAFCVGMAFGSPTTMIADWNEHRATTVVVLIAAIFGIPSLVETIVSHYRR